MKLALSSQSFTCQTLTCQLMKSPTCWGFQTAAILHVRSNAGWVFHLASSGTQLHSPINYQRFRGNGFSQLVRNEWVDRGIPAAQLSYRQ